MYSNCYVYVFLLLGMFCFGYSVLLRFSVYCCVYNCTVLPPPGVNLIAVNIYIILTPNGQFLDCASIANREKYEVSAAIMMKKPIY